MTDRPPLRVAVLIDGLGWGGAEMLLADFAVGAAAAGLQLTVAYLKDKDGSPAAARLRDVGVQPVLLGVDRLLQPSAVPAVRRHLRGVRPDLLHTHLGYADLLGGVAARSLRVPAVSTLHVMEWEGRGRDATKERLFAAARRHCMRRVVTVSESARSAYLGTGHDRADRVVTVHNGVVGRTRAGAGPGVRAELGLAPDDVVLAMVTVLRPGKGHELAVAAVDALRRRHPGVRLLVLGDGPSRADVAGLVVPLGDGVRLLGHRDDVMAVLDAVDVVVHPSAVDALPTALLEAMAAGVPVVASAVGGIPEIVDDGVTGVLVPAPPRAADLATALEPLVADAHHRRALGAAARERFEHSFTARRWAQRMRCLYDMVLGGG